MLRITQNIRSAISGIRSKSFDGIIAIWNITGMCNLRCKHCYASAVNRKVQEFSISDAERLAEEFIEIGVKMVIISGGEPLLNPHIFKIASKLKEKGISPQLSTNGTLINSKNIKEIQEIFDYVGISIDGPPEVHDRFRGKKGAFQKSEKALKMLLDAGVKTGIRFSLSQETSDFIHFPFELAEREGIKKIYISHVVNSGYAKGLRWLKTTERERKIRFVIEKSFYYVENQKDIEVVSGNNESDAVILYQIFRKKFPEKQGVLLKNLEEWGGNQAGCKILCIDPYGNVRPDPFFPVSIGNIREKNLRDIWFGENPILQFLRRKPRELASPCRDCGFLRICNGGSRSRAMNTFGDIKAPDPACYLLSCPYSFKANHKQQ